MKENHDATFKTNVGHSNRFMAEQHEKGFVKALNKKFANHLEYRSSLPS